LVADSAAASATTVIVAPYLDMAGVNTSNLPTAVTADGLTSFTAAFVLGNGCTATWDNLEDVSSDSAATSVISDAENDGARAIVSFGGAVTTNASNQSIDLPDTCTNPTTLAGVYESVLSQLGATAIDFDIEGNRALSDQIGIDNRFAAINILEGAEPDVTVSLTIQVGQSGLPTGANSELALLQTAKSMNTRIDLVNIETMDYGSHVKDMATTAENAAAGTLTQMQSVWPSDTYANLGLTPMIGHNDSKSEVFSTANAQTLASFVKTQQIGRLAFWSLNRDQKKCTKAKLSTCSKVKQTPLQFTKTFVQDA
jgi:hypothetical protein